MSGTPGSEKVFDGVAAPAVPPGDALQPAPAAQDANAAATPGPHPEVMADGLQDQTAYLPARQVIVVYLGLSLALACSFLEQSIIATALPRIASDLRSGKESSWVATAYLLSSLAFAPLYGRWSDIFGRKQVLMFSLVVFWVASLACAVAQTMLQLIIFRAFQGIGGGGLVTLVLIIISDIVSLKDRGKYMGVTESVIVLSNGVGPVLGGVFSQYSTWRLAFWINIPLVLLTLGVTHWFLPLKGVRGTNLRQKMLQIDYMGSVLTIAASVLILLGLNWGGVTYPWVSAPVLVPIILGVLTFAAFVVWEAKWAALPVIPMAIFRYATVVGVFLCTTCSGMTMFGMLYFIPQFMQLVRGNDYLQASVMTLPMLVPIAFFVFISGQILARTLRYRAMIIGGHASWCIAQGLLSTVDRQSSDAKIIGVLVMAGVSSGFTFQSELLAAQAAVERHEVSVVTGVRNFVRLLGSTLCLAYNGAIVNNALRSGVAALGIAHETVEQLLEDPTAVNRADFRATLTPAQHSGIVDAYLRGFRVVFLLTVAWQAAATLFAVFLIKHHDLNRPEEDKAFKEQGRDLLRLRKAGRAGDDDGELEAGTPAEKPAAPAAALATGPALPDALLLPVKAADPLQNDASHRAAS